MPARKWPKDDKPADWSEIVEPIREAIDYAYRLERTNIRRTIPWTGLELGNASRHTALQPDKNLRAGQLAYELNEQGRDALDVLLGMAIGLGIEQGRRIERERTQPHRLLLETALVVAKEL